MAVRCITERQITAARPALDALLRSQDPRATGVT
jgi:hypothetical protein